MNVDEYIDTLPEDRRIAIRSVRELVNSRLPSGYEEGVQYGMISWFVPFTTLAETYNNQPLCIASLASQKQYMSIHLLSLYFDPKIQKWFESEYKKTGKKLDMGKGCVRFKTLDDLALQVVGDVIAKVNVEDHVATYHAIQAASKGAVKTAKPATKKPAKKATAKKATAKKATAKKATAKKPIANKRAKLGNKPAAKSKQRR